MKEEYIKLLQRYASAWTGHGLFAMKLVESFNPKVTVDLGVDYGFSTFCLAYPQIGNVYGIDWFQGDEHAGYRDTYPLVENLYQEVKQSFGVSNIEFIKGDFEEVAKTWNKPIDILHIDGFHSYEAVTNDFKNWTKFCHEESIVLFHDIDSYPGTIGVFFNELEGYKHTRPQSAGLGIFTFSRKNHLIINDFINE
jgi:predicted O-methyltransferase YrrM